MYAAKVFGSAVLVRNSESAACCVGTPMREEAVQWVLRGLRALRRVI